MFNLRRRVRAQRHLRWVVSFSKPSPPVIGAIISYLGPNNDQARHLWSYSPLSRIKLIRALEEKARKIGTKEKPCRTGMSIASNLRRGQ